MEHTPVCGHRRRRQRGATLPMVAVLVLVATACTLHSYEYLGQGQPGAEGGTGGSVPGTLGQLGGSTADHGGAVGTDASGMGNTHLTGGTNGSGGTSSASGGGGASAVGSATSSGGTSSASGGGGASAAGDTAGVLGPWHFDTDAELSTWLPKGAQMTVVWVEQGETTPTGAMSLTATAAMAQVQDSIQATDLRDRVLTARIRTATSTAGVKPFAMSGTSWADGGTYQVSTEWSTVSMALNSPDYGAASFNPAQITAFGLQVTTACTLWVDSIAVQ